jgi:hypothetical protein
MKNKVHTLLIAAAATLAVSASAQITPDPVGINTFAAPSAFNTASYLAKFGPAGMDIYYASQANLPSAQVATWTFVTQTSDISPVIPWLAGGGTVKTIFMGESAASLNDFGYIKSTANIASAASYVPLATNISNPSAFIQSGWETYANYGAGEQLDFWLNKPTDAFGAGGAYFSFLLNTVGSQFAGGDPYTHVKYQWTTVLTEYQDGSGVTVQGNVDTLLIAFEDLRGPALPPGGLPTIPPGDADYTDFIVGFQFLPPQTPVPEPSTYGLMGAAALVGLVGYRRLRAAKKA